MQLRRLLPIAGGRLADKRQRERNGSKGDDRVAKRCADHGNLHR
jgi:hypothetical protein